MSLLITRGLAVGLRTGDTVTPVIRGLNLMLAPGRALGLVGESGAGKSTIGRAVTQTLPPELTVTAGSVEFAGYDMAALPAHFRRRLFGREITFLPPAPAMALDPLMTIRAHLDEHHRRLGVRGADELATYAYAALVAARLSDPVALFDRYPHQLGADTCQQVLLAMAFAARPRLVVADEPTRMLDSPATARVLGLIGELRRRDGAAMLFLTHDLRLAAAVCDDIAVLHGGDIVEIGPTRAVMAGPRHPYTRALQLATPSTDGPRRSLFVLAGPSPNPRALARMEGCRFARRCPIAVDYCKRIDPPLEGTVHRTACVRTGLTTAIEAPADDATFSGRRADVAMDVTPMLEVAGLEKTFTVHRAFRSRTVTALRGVSFHVSGGEFVGLLGGAGSGKTALARLVVGLDRPDAGRIVVAGVEVAVGDAAVAEHWRQTVQMAFADQPGALAPWRRVGAIATQALVVHDLSARQHERRARDLLAEMGLPVSVAMRRPGTLSAAERVRVGLARALCDRPALLVADDIAAGLDVAAQAELLQLLTRLRRERGLALLITSRDPAFVRQLCDRVLVIEAGEIVEQGPTRAVFAAPRHAATQRLLAALPQAE